MNRGSGDRAVADEVRDLASMRPRFMNRGSTELPGQLQGGAALQ